MFCLVALPCVFSLAGINSGSDGATLLLRNDEARWARQLSLKQSYVRKIVEAAGCSQDDEVRIENLDVRHLRARKHILLVTAAGNGHCLTLSVVASKKESMEKIWEASELGGGGFCH